MASTTSTPSASQTTTATSDGASPSCTTAIPGQYGNVPFDACNSYYNYDPQFAPAVAVSVIFGIFTTVHLAEAIIFKKRYAWVLIMGCLWEMLGFIFGALGAHDQQSIVFVSAHQIFFLLAPLWINAFVYMSFSRMVHFYLPERKIWWIRSTFMSKVFVGSDIATFLVQIVGALMTNPGTDANTVQLGLHIYEAGIGIQQACIVGFVLMMIVFHRRAAAVDTREAYDLGFSEHERKKNWRPTLYGIYVVLAAITVRIIYRLCEYSGGITPSNPLPFHEEYSYALDAFPMMIAMLILALFHPGRVLVGPDSDFREYRKAKKQEKRRAKEEKKASKRKLGAYEDMRQPMEPVYLSQSDQ